jgi:two-component sensor histidine kinase
MITKRTAGTAGDAAKPVFAAAAIAIGTAFLMLCYEAVKELVAPGLTKWGSHTVTIIVSGVFAGLAGFIALKRLHAINTQLRSEITERIKAEADAKKRLEERQILFRELQHRVKNSFMMITSLIYLSQTECSSDEAKTALKEVAERVCAISEMYDMLYSTGSTDEVDLDSYLARILGLLNRDWRITVRTSLSAGRIATTAAANIGLIVTELMTNAIKHAFPDGRTGTVSIAVSRDERGVKLHFSDDGVGMPSDVDSASSRSIGLTILRSLVKQLGGEYNITRRNGTSWLFFIPSSSC